MKAGFAEIDMTPTKLGRLGRLIAAPTQVLGIHSPLFARLAVFDDGECRTAILCLDMNFMFSQNVPEIRAVIAQESQMEPVHIMVTCTHTHNSFPTTPWHEDDGTDYEGLDYLLGFLPRLTHSAVNQLEECTIEASSIDVPGTTQNRRCCYRSEDGTMHVATHGPHDAENFLGVEGPTDDELKVLICRNPGGDVLGGIVNFASHPTTMFSEPVYSSSYIGPLVRTLQEELGGTFGFLYGLSGNLCCAGRANGADATERIGTLLGNKALEALEQGSTVSGDRIKVSREMIALPLRRVTKEQIKAAKYYQKMNPEDVDQQELCQKLYGHDFIFYHQSRRHVTVFINEIIGTWEFQRRSARRSLTHDFEVQVIHLGNLAIVGFASELFCEVKHSLQRQSPASHTFFATMANGGHGYVPPAESLANGGYETCVGIASMFTEEASSILEESALRQLGSSICST